MQTIFDRVEIEALRGEYTDAASMRDFDRFASLFTVDGVWEMPQVHVRFVGREEIRAGIERLQENWEFLIQNPHPGTIQLAGDTATGRAYIAEIGRFRDGDSHQNYAIFHDQYQRTATGWQFKTRTYEIKYHDESPLTGSTTPIPSTLATRAIK